MFFLTQFKFKNDGTVDKGTTNYAEKNEAIIQFHISISSAMSKADTSKFVALIIDENGTVIKREVYEVPTVEETVEELAD